jgi:hypothetical protein
MMRIAVDDAIALLILFLLAGGGIIVLDAFIIRRLRRSRDPGQDET